MQKAAGFGVAPIEANAIALELVSERCAKSYLTPVISNDPDPKDPKSRLREEK